MNRLLSSLFALVTSLGAALGSASESETPKFGDAKPQQYVLKRRASEIDTRARPHPEIDFVFADKQGKPVDVQHAVVDTRAEPRGKLVIWLMGYNALLFERIAKYGYHGIQPHYAN